MFTGVFDESHSIDEIYMTMMMMCFMMSVTLGTIMLMCFHDNIS